MENKEGMWQDLVQKKYKLQNGICRVNSTMSDSPCWADLLKIKQIYMRGRMMVVGDGKQTDFWHDCRCGDKPLKDQFPELF